MAICDRSANISKSGPIYFLAALILFVSCGGSPSSNIDSRDGISSELETRVNSAAALIPRLRPFFESMGQPQQYDWLGTYREPGQTFAEYTQASPTLPNADRNVIYIVKIGSMTTQQSRTIGQTAEYLSAFYGLRHKFLTPKPLDLNSRTLANDTRKLSYTPQRQLRTGYVLDKMLIPSLPSDAAALIGMTAYDLYPDSSMTFVFGQGRFTDRVAILSVFRLEKSADNMTFLRRSLKLATHELGHVFSFRHCTLYECLMSGTNHIGETDRRPIDACPECTAKVIYAGDLRPGKRYDELVSVCEKFGLNNEATMFRKKSSAIAAIR